MYRALYRKWRPGNFKDMVGQEAITGALLCQIQTTHIAHAYLFTGTRGTGKTSCAKVFAKAVNCENLQEEGPCNTCPCCLGIESGGLLDVVEIDAASNNGVDDVRELRNETMYRPGRCLYKVYIIDEVHMLSIQAFNALLKILEEPPSHVIFILATTEIHKVPATILSRCQRFDFLRIGRDAIAQRLLWVSGEENIDLSEPAASLLAVLADGSLRDALSLLDTCAAFGGTVDEERVRTMAGITDKNHLFSLAEASAKGDMNALIQKVNALRERSVDMKRLCEELVAHYRNCLLAVLQPSAQLLTFLPNDEAEQYKLAAKNLTEQECIFAMRRLAEAIDKMGRSANPRVELELALFDIAFGADALRPPVHKMPPTPPPSPALQAPQTEPPLPETAAPQKTNVSEPFQKPTNSPPLQAPPASSKTPPPPKNEPAAPWQEHEAPSERPSDSSPPPASEALQEPAPPQSPAPPQNNSVEIFASWPQVVDEIKKLDPMVYSYIKNTKAYFDGKRILLDGGDVFLEFMRSNEKVSEIIKTGIQKICNTRYGIGPYIHNQKEEPLRETTQQTLAEWQKKGIPIEYENKDSNKGDKE